MFSMIFGIMEKHMRPPLLDADANSPDRPRNWRHWKRCFQSYIQRIEGVTDADKLDILISLLHASVYAYIRDCKTYGDAMTCVDNAFHKTVNEVFARHRLNIVNFLKPSSWAR